MTSWVDSHCHLQERYLAEDAEGAVDALRRAKEAGVDAVVCVGTDEATSRQAVALVADARAGLLGEGIPVLGCAVGLHPHEAESGTGWLGGLLDESPQVTAVGECGLDYFYEHSPKEVQRRAFAEQIALSHERGLSLVVHARDAWGDLFDVFASEGVPERTVIHCFTGGPGEAEQCVAAGMVVSISGSCTFKNAIELRDAIPRVPVSQLMVETDSPFLAPVPHRGRTNEPAYVPLVGAAVAELLGRPITDLAASTTEVAARSFSLPL